MGGANRYGGLRQLTVLMALDICCFAAAGVVLSGKSLLGAALESWTQLPASTLNAVYLYVAWSLSAFRVLVWALTLAAFSRLKELRRSFGKAQTWYILRILAFFIMNLAAGLAQNSTDTELSFEARLPLFSGLLFFLWGVALLSEALLLSMGVRAALTAGAELLDTFGLDGPAEKNLRCGKQLVRLAAVLAVLLLSAILLLCGEVFLSLFQGDPESVLLAALLLLAAAALLLSIPVVFGVVWFRILAVVRMGQTYRIVKELAE